MSRCIQSGVLLPAYLQAILLALSFSYIPITFKCIHLDQKRNFHAFLLVKKKKRKEREKERRREERERETRGAGERAQ